MSCPACFLQNHPPPAPAETRAVAVCLCLADAHGRGLDDVIARLCTGHRSIFDAQCRACARVAREGHPAPSPGPCLMCEAAETVPPAYQDASDGDRIRSAYAMALSDVRAKGRLAAVTEALCARCQEAYAIACALDAETPS